MTTAAEINAAEINGYFEGALAKDFLRLVCEADPIGSGIGRAVYSCLLRPDLVIKIETPSYSFQNIIEWEIWKDTHGMPKLRRWLAPCEFISPCGMVLAMKRTIPATRYPERLPRFLNDTKRSNYGVLNKRFVCHDYGLTTLVRVRAPMQMVKAAWWGD